MIEGKWSGIGLLLAISLSIFLPSIALSEKTVKTISFPAGFIPSLSPNNPYSKTFTFESPDGFVRFYFIRATLFADNHNQQVARFFLQLDNQWCVPRYYDIPPKQKRYRMDFDCTGVLQSEGQYEGVFRSNRNLKNVYGDWSMTYKNNPTPSITSIGGTEYSVGEPSRIVVQILNSDGSPLNNETCFTAVRDSNDNLMFDNVSLIYVNGSNGLYSYSFNTSLPIGLYSIDSYCDFNGTKVYSADTFHVGEWTEDIKNITTSENYISFVGGTEYQREEDVKIVVQFLTNWGVNPVNDRYCRFTLFSPNNTPIFSDVALDYIPSSNGLYSYTWVNSNKSIGVYTLDVKCSQNPNFYGNVFHSSSTFHVWSGNISYVGQAGNVAENGTLVKFSGGTEYTSGEEGLFVIQFMKVLAGKPMPIDDADFCNATMFYPNRSVWLSNVGFTYIPSSNGLYYYEATIPDVEGVYLIDGHCGKGGIDNYDSDTFHVAEWTNRIFNISDSIFAINQSIFNKLFSIQDDLAGIEGELGDINSTILGVNDTLLSVNQTIFDKLLLIQDDLTGIVGELTNISDLLILHNQTVVDKLSDVKDDVEGVRELIVQHNATAVEKLFSIQDDLGDVTNLILSHDTTVMDKLYSIQDEISNINQTLVNATFNVTIPTEMEITNTSIDRISEDIILKMLEHARILNRRIVNFDKQFLGSMGGISFGIFLISGIVYYIKKRWEK